LVTFAEKALATLRASRDTSGRKQGFCNDLQRREFAHHILMARLSRLAVVAAKPLERPLGRNLPSQSAKL